LARRLDFGPEFLSKGYATQEPPNVRGAFPLLVPQVDADGNDSPAILIDNATAANRAVNIPEFVNMAPDGIQDIQVHIADVQ